MHLFQVEYLLSWLKSHFQIQRLDFLYTHVGTEGRSAPYEQKQFYGFLGLMGPFMEISRLITMGEEEGDGDGMKKYWNRE